MDHLVHPSSPQTYSTYESLLKTCRHFLMFTSPYVLASLLEVALAARRA